MTQDEADEIVKAIFEDKETFESLCNLIKAAINLGDAKSEATDRFLEKVYKEKE